MNTIEFIIKPGDVLVEGTDHIITVTNVYNNHDIEYFEHGYFHETIYNYITKRIIDKDEFQYFNNIDINVFPVGTIYADENMRRGYMKIGDNYFIDLADNDVVSVEYLRKVWINQVIFPEMPFKFANIHAGIKCDITKIRQDLEELGYVINPNNIIGSAEYTYVYNGGIYTSIDFKKDPDKELTNDIIDCGTNKEFFLALAAMREDSDYKQYFVSDTEESWANLGLYKPVGSMSYSLVCDFMSIDDKQKYHKATVEEIVNYFNKNNNDGK